MTGGDDNDLDLPGSVELRVRVGVGGLRGWWSLMTALDVSVEDEVWRLLSAASADVAGTGWFIRG